MIASSSRGQFVVFDDALQPQSTTTTSAGVAHDAKKASQHGKGAGAMPRSALSNITNNNGGAGRQQTREKQKVVGKQHASFTAPPQSKKSAATVDDASPIRLPPTVPGRSPPRDIVHERRTGQDQDQGGNDAVGACDDGPWLGSIFSSAASSTRSSIVSPRDMEESVGRSSVPSDAAAALRAMAHQDRDNDVGFDAANDGRDHFQTQEQQQQQQHQSSPAPQGYEDYAPEAVKDGPEHSWWECDYCGLAFNTFDDASTHEAGCTLNQDHVAAVPSGKCLSPITEVSQEAWQTSPASTAGSPSTLVHSSSPAVLSRTLFNSPEGQSAVKSVAASEIEPSVKVPCSPGVQLTATLCYANDQTSASPHAAAPCHVDGQVAGISSPNTAPHIESCANGKGDGASPGFDAAVMTHQQEVEQIRTHFQKIEADQLKHIEGLQAALMSANEALLEMNQKMQVQSKQESIVLERVQIADQKNSQLTSDVMVRDGLLDEARQAIDQARQLACEEQKRHAAVTSELNSHIKTLAHEVERQRGRADAAEEALKREKQNTQRLQELVIQARTGFANAAGHQQHPAPGPHRSSRSPSFHYSSSSHSGRSSPVATVANNLPQQRSSSPCPNHYTSSSPMPQAWIGSHESMSMTSSVRSDRSSSPTPSMSAASLPGSPEVLVAAAAAIPSSSPSSSPFNSPRGRNHRASFVSPPPQQLTSSIVNPALSAPNPRHPRLSTSPPPMQSHNLPWSHQAVRHPAPQGLSNDPNDAGARSPLGPVLIRFEPEWQIRQGPIYKAAPLPKPSSVTSSASSSRSASPYTSPMMRPMAHQQVAPLRFEPFDQPRQAW